MIGSTPELFFCNLPEIEALPFDVCVSVFGADETDNVFNAADEIPHIYREVVLDAMHRTSTLFGVSLQVWSQERRRVG